MDEDCLYNANETPFSVNFDTSRTLVRKGYTEVRYSDVFSGAMGMQMMDMFGGGLNPQFEVPLIIFQNERCSHPIQLV